MLLTTLIVLTIWLAFVWFCDPDGFRRGKRQCLQSRPKRTEILKHQ
jgi:hypothetical protein